MKAILLFTIFLFFYSLSFSQEIENDTLKKVVFGVSLTRQKVIPRLKDNGLSGYKSTFGVSIASEVHYNLSKVFSLRSGLAVQYLKTFGERDFSIVFPCDIDGNTTYILNSYVDPHVQTIYLGLPLETRVNIIAKNDQLFMSLGFESWLKVIAKTRGVITECGMNNTSSSPYPVSLEHQNQGLFLLTYGLGGEFLLKNQRKLSFEPRLEYSLNNVFRSDPNTTSITFSSNRILNIGLRIGLKI